MYIFFINLEGNGIKPIPHLQLFWRKNTMITISYEQEGGFVEGHIVIRSIEEGEPAFDLDGDCNDSEINQDILTHAYISGTFTPDIIAEDVREFVRQITEMYEQGEIQAISDIEGAYVNIAVAHSEEWMIEQLAVIIKRRLEVAHSDKAA